MLVIISGYFLYKSKMPGIDFEQYYVSGLIGFVFSLWALGGFAYYVNRSFASGQLQILLLPIAISLASVVGISLRSGAFSFASGFLYSKINRGHPNFVWVIPFVLIFSLPFSAVIHSPNPWVEFSRIKDGVSNPRWPMSGVLASVSDASIAAKYAAERGEVVGFFGNSASYIYHETGVTPAVIFNSTKDLLISQDAEAVACEFILEGGFDALVLGDDSIEVFQQQGRPLCGLFVQQDIPGLRPGFFALRIDSVVK
jgi:hypothetical protein